MDGTTAVGFEVDLMDAVAAKMGLTCEYLPAMKFDSIIPLIKQGGKADCGVSNFTITDERKQEIDFTDPYIDSNQGVVVKADSDKTTAEALNADGVKIACQSGTTGEAWAQENLPKATIVSLDDPVQAVTGVSTGIYDAASADLPVMKYLCSNSFTDCQVAIEIPTGEQYWHRGLQVQRRPHRRHQRGARRPQGRRHHREPRGQVVRLRNVATLCRQEARFSPAFQ